MSEWVSEWMNEWMNEWMSEWVNEWVKERTYSNDWIKEFISNDELERRRIPLGRRMQFFTISKTGKIYWIGHVNNFWTRSIWRISSGCMSVWLSFNWLSRDSSKLKFSCERVNSSKLSFRCFSTSKTLLNSRIFFIMPLTGSFKCWMKWSSG